MEKRVNEIVNRLKKTEVVDDKYDYQGEREERDRKERVKEVRSLFSCFWA